MVVCKFFLQGECRFGENCRFEHQLNSNKTGNQQFGSNQGQQKLINPKTGTEIDVTALINSVQNDVVSGERGRQWLLSCYAPFKEKPLYPGFIDLSFEEVRFGYIDAQKSNTSEQYNQELQKILTEAKARYKALENPTKEIVQMLKDIYNNELSGSNRNYTAENKLGPGSTNPNMFGQNTSSVFSQSKLIGGGTSIFGQNATQNNTGSFGQQPTGSIFGRPNASVGTGSVFGQPQASASIFQPANTTPNSGNVFAQQQSKMSIFGSKNGSLFEQKPNTGNVFGQQNNGSIFGQQNSTPMNTSIFGQQSNTQKSNNVFGQPLAAQNTSSPFGKPNTNSIFGQQSNFQNTNSLFGQQNTTQNSSNIFRQQNNAPSSSNIFGQQKPTDNTNTLFGNPTNGQASSNIFAQQNNSQTPNAFGQRNSGGIFGQNSAPPSGGSIFSPQNSVPRGNSIFGQQTGGNNVFETKVPDKSQNSNNIFASESKNLFNVQAQSGLFVNTQQAFQNNQTSSVFGRSSEQTSLFTNQGSNSAFQTNSNLPQSTSIFGLKPLGSASGVSITGKSLKKDINLDAYSKLEDLTEEEIKWFNSDVFDINTIPEKPPAYEMCF